MANQPGSPPRFDPKAIAGAVGMFVKAMIEIIFYLTAGAVVIGAGYVIVRVVLWGAVTILDALGVGNV